MSTGAVPAPSGCSAPDALLQFLVAKVPVFLWATDRELRITSATGALLRLAGIEARAIVGRPIDALFHAPESQSAHRAAVRGSAHAFTLEIDSRVLDAFVEPLLDVDGHLLGVAGVALDVTERRVAESALRISEQSYRSLIEEAPYAVCQVTESGQLLQVNPAMLEMLGYLPDAGDDLLMCDLPVIFASPEGFTSFQKALLIGTAVQGYESAWRRRDGREIQVRVGGRALRDAAGKVLCFNLLAENITEKKELADRLQQGQKMHMIGQMAGGVAHDFNNLLTIINGYCDLLLLRHNGEEEPFESLRIIRRAGERAAALTKQLLMFSRQQVTVTQVVPLNGVVTEVAELSRRVIAENIRVIQHLAPETGSVMADGAQLHQMLMNLVVNARDAMPAGGNLTIETSLDSLDPAAARQLDLPEGDYAVLSVADTGVGMNDEVQARIFEPFFTTKPAGKGTGLGLATVYALVRQSRGAITVKSRPGAGTTFRIYFPRFDEPEPAGPATSQRNALTRGTSTILVVEDDPAVRMFTTRVLAEAGYELLEACDGDQALELAGRYPDTIHLLVTDMVMPGLNGIEVATELRLLRPGCRVLLVSGYSELLLGENAIDKTIHYLQKPFSPEKLSQMVKNILSEP